MTTKKSTRKKMKKGSVAKRRSKRGTVIVYTDNMGLMLADEDKSNGHRCKQPFPVNPESDEEREKRLAARKALTLKAARIAYENHHQRKAS